MFSCNLTNDFYFANAKKKQLSYRNSSACTYVLVYSFFQGCNAYEPYWEDWTKVSSLSNWCPLVASHDIQKSDLKLPWTLYLDTCQSYVNQFWFWYTLRQWFVTDVTHGWADLEMTSCMWTLPTHLTRTQAVVYIHTAFKMCLKPALSLSAVQLSQNDYVKLSDYDSIIIQNFHLLKWDIFTLDIVIWRFPNIFALFEKSLLIL